MATPTVAAQRGVEAEALQVRLRGNDVHRAAGLADPEQARIRPAGDFNRLHVVEVHRDGGIGREVAPRRVDTTAVGADRAPETARQSADAVGTLRIAGGLVRDAPVLILGNEREIGGALSARLIFEHVVDIEYGGVDHLLHRDDRDRGGYVLELRVQARPRHGVGGLIAFVVGDDAEGREHDGLVFQRSDAGVNQGLGRRSGLGREVSG